jgi:hypothetical protein
MDDQDRLDILLTEYEQTGEEYRTRHRLLHNSYYLFIVSLLLFVPALISQRGNPRNMAYFLIVGSVAGFVLGFAILTHFVERHSAASLRTRTEQAIEERTNDEISFEHDIQRPISIQYHVVGNNADIDNSGNIDVKQNDLGTIWNCILSLPDYSAKTLAQGILLLSTGQAIFGVWLLISV